jgi:hypothetical protein
VEPPRAPGEEKNVLATPAPRRGTLGSMRTGLPRRIVLPAALIAVAVLVAPAACFFPSYTFDLPTTTSSSSSGGGATSSTSTTTTTTTTTTSSGGGTGGVPCPVADCSDPTCLSDYECVDEIPAGWAVPGYVALYEGAAGQSVPDCTAAQPTPEYTGNGGLDFLPANCTPCGCGGASGQDCQLTVDLDSSKAGLQPVQVLNTPCHVSAGANTSLTVPVPWGGVCYFDETLPGGQICPGTPSGPCNSSVQSDPATVTGGTCAATGGTVASVPVPTWDVNVKACGGTTPGKGCPSGQFCVPKPPSPFNGHVCLEQPGEVACPTGSSFSNQVVYYGNSHDTRGCTGCSCGPPSSGSCEITITLYGDTTPGTCLTQVAQFVAGGTSGCANIVDSNNNFTNPPIYGRTDAITKPPSGSTCAPLIATMPDGDVTATAPTTFCCIQ